MDAHEASFRYFIEAMRAESFTLERGSLELIDNEIHDNLEQASHRALERCFRLYRSGRVFDFQQIAVHDAAGLADKYLDASFDLHPPFDDWEFVIFLTHTSDEKHEQSAFLVVRQAAENAIEIAEFGISARTQTAKHLRTIMAELPLSRTSQFKAIVKPKSAIAEAEAVRVGERIVNPCLAALLMLNTRGVAIDEIKAPRAERRRAARDGKEIPSTWCVDTALYFTAVKGQAATSRTVGGGSHRSPVPHLRRGHWRSLRDSRRVWVRDCLVNVRSEGAASFVERRDGYRIPE